MKSEKQATIKKNKKKEATISKAEAVLWYYVA